MNTEETVTISKKRMMELEGLCEYSGIMLEDYTK
jgi:hypothetical protein